jgi:hypothetical protein
MVIVSLCSCSVVRQGIVAGTPQVVDTAGGVQMYDLQLTYKNVNFGGMLLLKREGNDKNRFVLTSTFGMTVFDIETSGNGYKVNYVIQAINHRKVLYLLWSDFSILMRPDFFTRIHYTYTDQGYLKSLIRSGSVTKAVMNFNNYLQAFPVDIEIDHPYLKLNIKLKKLEDVTGTL